MDPRYLRCVELEPDGPAKSTVIWLHGLGADGHDFEPIVPHLGLDKSLGVRFVFPHAPRRPVAINMGMIMPAWYDIRMEDLRREPDKQGILESAAQIRNLIVRENERGVPTRRVILAGFSQGGAIALHVALRYPQPLAGLLALSTYLAGEDSLEAEASAANRAIPIFQAHGNLDPMVPIERGEEARDRLRALGYSVQWKTYPMQHEVHPEEIEDIGKWLGKNLSD